MTVSILIPAYKPIWFKECLQSALKQDFPVKEVVVSDDCPTDEIEKIVRAFDDERIKYHRNKTLLKSIGKFSP